MPENNNNPRLNKEIELLPKNIKRYLLSKRFDQDINKVSEKLNLDEKQKDRVEEETVLILMGLEELVDTLSSLHKVSSDESKRLDIFDEIISLTDPFVEDIVNINIRHKKEAEEGNLKKNVPVPPPKPAPVAEKEDESEQEKKEVDSSEKQPKPTGFEKGKINSLKNLKELDQLSKHSDNESETHKGLTYNED